MEAIKFLEENEEVNIRVTCLARGDKSIFYLRFGGIQCKQKKKMLNEFLFFLYEVKDSKLSALSYLLHRSLPWIINKWI